MEHWLDYFMDGNSQVWDVARAGRRAV